ncbi:MAG TPA: hypothetical protein VKV95_11365 [Terriglobia bacterium]|nr:hypothetical protein [Terriglobia bacterium]
MAKTMTKSEVNTLLRKHLKRRTEIGFGNLIVNTVLEPPNPFEPDKRRLPRKAFVLVALSLLALVGVFVGFNL